MQIHCQFLMLYTPLAEDESTVIDLVLLHNYIYENLFLYNVVDYFL